MSEPRAVPRFSIGHDHVWRLHARCRGSDPGRFYLKQGDFQGVREAKAVCASCPVRTDCLLAALASAEEYGLWGGAGEPVRRVLRTLPRTHAGYDEECTCAFCSAVGAHFARLDGEASEGPLVTFGPEASHGRASTYGRGCRCEPCRQAKYEQMAAS